MRRAELSLQATTKAESLTQGGGGEGVIPAHIRGSPEASLVCNLILMTTGRLDSPARSLMSPFCQKISENGGKHPLY